MAPFSQISEIDEDLLDPIDEEDEAEINTYDPNELAANKESIRQVVDSCSALFDVVATDAEASDVDAMPGKPLPCKITTAMITEAAELLPKFCGIAKVLRHSTLAKAEWEVICSNAKKPDIAIRRSVRTRWNTATGMVDDILSMEDQINRLISTPGLGLEKYKLLPSQWSMARSLQPLLRAFLILTHKFSTSNSSMIAEVIPMMDQLTTGLDKLRASKEIHPMVRYAAALTQQMVNKLYRRSDESWLFRVAIGTSNSFA